MKDYMGGRWCPGCDGLLRGKDGEPYCITCNQYFSLIEGEEKLFVLKKVIDLEATILEGPLIIKTKSDKAKWKFFLDQFRDLDPHY